MRFRCRLTDRFRGGTWLGLAFALAAAFLSGCGADEAERPPMVGPQGKGVVTVKKSEDGVYVEQDGGKVGEEYDVIQRPAFTPAGKVAFAARSGDSWRVIRGGEQVGGEYDYVAGVTGGAEGSVAFLAKEGDKWRVLRDGSPVGDPYEHVKGPVYSPDGKTLVFTAMENGRAFLVRDGVRQRGEYDWAGEPAFGPDGESVLFVAMTPDGQVLVKDGAVVTDAYEEIEKWALAPGGGSVALLVEEDWKFSLIKDGVVLAGGFPRFQRVTKPVFGPDGKTVVFAAAETSRQWFVFRDGVRQGDEIEAEILADLVFSPDGRSIACRARRDGRWLVLKDGQPVSDEYRMISNLRSDKEQNALVFFGLRRKKPEQVTIAW